MSRNRRSVALGMVFLSAGLAACGGGGPSGPDASVVVEEERLEVLPGSPPVCVVRFTVTNADHDRVDVLITWQAYDARGAALGEAFAVMTLKGGERRSDRSTNFLKDWDPLQSPQCSAIARFERTSVTVYGPS